MDASDVALVSTLTPHNVELDRLIQQHEAFEQEIETLRTHRWLSATEEQKLRELKKRKLQGRDRIEAILAEHRH